MRTRQVQRFLGGVVVLALGCLAEGPCVSAQSEVSFLARQDFRVGFNPVSVTVGDFNADGRLDLATANHFTSTVSIRLGQGDGTFRAVPDVALGGQPAAITVGDFNADGRLDLATANNPRFFSGTVSILLGRGDGTFQPAQDVAMGFGAHAVTVGDFNADGRLDLATANFSFPSTVSILLGQGDGTFQPAQDVAVGSEPQGSSAKVTL